MRTILPPGPHIFLKRSGGLRPGLAGIGEQLGLTGQLPGGFSTDAGGLDQTAPPVRPAWAELSGAGQSTHGARCIASPETRLGSALEQDGYLLVRRHGRFSQMPGLAIWPIGKCPGQDAVSTPPLDGGGHAHHSILRQRVKENEPAGVLIHGDQEGLLQGRKAVQQARTARGGGQDAEVPGPLQRRKKEQRAACRGQAANAGRR